MNGKKLKENDLVKLELGEQASGPTLFQIIKIRSNEITARRVIDGRAIYLSPQLLEKNGYILK